MNKDTSFIHSDYDVSSNLSNEETNYKSKDDFKLLNEKSKEINSTNKKGRKTKKEKDYIDFTQKKRFHRNSDKDNLTLKIITHFKNNFLIRFLNHLVFKKFKRQKFAFKNFTCDTKNKKKMKVFMEKTLYDICKLDLSRKYKNYSKVHNLKSLNKIQNEEIKKWKIKDLYSKYYLCKNINDVIPSNKKKKVESLYDFSQKAENEKLKKQIEKIGETLILEYNTKEEKQDNNYLENDNTINNNNIVGGPLRDEENYILNQKNCSEDNENEPFNIFFTPNSNFFLNEEECDFFK